MGFFFLGEGIEASESWRSRVDVAEETMAAAENPLPD
jgi:hypothetical protein